jgi:hypothetical protein
VFVEAPSIWVAFLLAVNACHGYITDLLTGVRVGLLLRNNAARVGNKQIKQIKLAQSSKG